MKVLAKSILFLFFLFSLSQAVCQEELKWQSEIDKLNKKEYQFEEGKDIVVLTGSSSARFWLNVSDQFPQYEIVNTGFGGSQMHELLYFIDDLIIKYSPNKVLIYEGDNDIAAGKSSKTIMKTTKKVIKKIKRALPNSKIYIISPKPSLARWELKTAYLELNSKLKEYCGKKKNLDYIDVWFPMLNSEGIPIKDIFIKDGLHMNKKGYDIWAEAVEKAMSIK